jgi:hypothetical protein
MQLCIETLAIWSLILVRKLPVMEIYDGDLFNGNDSAGLWNKLCCCTDIEYYPFALVFA